MSHAATMCWGFFVSFPEKSDLTYFFIFIFFFLLPPPDHCMAPKKAGPCRGAFPRWHYNAASEKCEEFSYGGCKGNLNNYLNMDECTRACYGSGISRLHPHVCLLTFGKSGLFIRISCEVHLMFCIQSI